MRGIAPWALGLGLGAGIVMAGCGAGAGTGSSSGASAPAQGAPSGSSSSSATTSAAAPSGAAVTGTYAIATGSTASYTAQETFLQQNLKHAPVGTTSGVTGTLSLAAGRFQPSQVTVDLRGLATDSAMRDRRVQSTLDTAQYPNAVFKVTGEQGGSQPVRASGTATVQLTGDLTVENTTKPVVWNVAAALVGGALHVSGSTTLQMTDFGVRPPSIAGFVSVEDGLKLAVDLTARKS